MFSAGKPEAGLYLVATPIGNLGDMTIRGLEILAGADLIACEDTRVTGKLLRHFGIKTKMVSYHEYNASEVGPKLIDEIAGGKSVALVADAGTPLVSDPGFRLVEAAREDDIRTTPLPGASAPLAALVASGMPNDQWTFCGFLPTKQGARKNALEAHANSPATLIFFESPNRLTKTLQDMIAVFGPDRKACVARELTKLHEEIETLPLSNLAIYFDNKTVKGEIVILVAPATQEKSRDPKDLLLELLKTMPVSKAAAEAADLTGQSKRELYQLALSLHEKE